MRDAGLVRRGIEFQHKSARKVTCWQESIHLRALPRHVAWRRRSLWSSITLVSSGAHLRVDSCEP
jgi:hypothetical protein